MNITSVTNPYRPCCHYCKPLKGSQDIIGILLSGIRVRATHPEGGLRPTNIIDELKAKFCDLKYLSIGFVMSGAMFKMPTGIVFTEFIKSSSM